VKHGDPLTDSLAYFCFPDGGDRATNISNIAIELLDVQHSGRATNTFNMVIELLILWIWSSSY